MFLRTTRSYYVYIVVASTYCTYIHTVRDNNICGICVKYPKYDILKNARHRPPLTPKPPNPCIRPPPPPGVPYCLSCVYCTYICIAHLALYAYVHEYHNSTYETLYSCMYVRICIFIYVYQMNKECNCLFN